MLYDTMLYVYIQINMTYVDTINIYVSIGSIYNYNLSLIHFDLIIHQQLLIKKYEKFILTSSQQLVVSTIDIINVSYISILIFDSEIVNKLCTNLLILFSNAV